MKLEAEQVRLPAIHEAGHAVFCWRYGYLMSNRCGDGVLIDGEFSGMVHMQSQIYSGIGEQLPRNRERWRRVYAEAMAEAEISFAGPQAERRYLRLRGRPIRPLMLKSALDDQWWGLEEAEESGETLGDTASAIRVLSEFVQHEELLAALRLSRDRVTRLLRHPQTWTAVEAVADGLLAHGHLDSEQTEAIIESVSPPQERPWRV